MPRGFDPIWKHTSKTTKSWACNYCSKTSNSLKPACVEQHLAHVGVVIRCCPGVPDDVKAAAKQITEGRAAPKLVKKQSAEVAIKGAPS
jgi:hypothetical protein